MVFSPSMSWNPERIQNDPERMEQTLNSESAYFLRFVQLRLATWLEDRSSSQFLQNSAYGLVGDPLRESKVNSSTDLIREGVGRDVFCLLPLDLCVVGYLNKEWDSYLDNWSAHVAPDANAISPQQLHLGQC